MEYRPLGRSKLKVSSVCLGTMTWGHQNSEAEAHEQLDYALGRDINMIDVAEMYPVPANADTQGLTEAYIGSWIAQRKNRDKYILATKVVGRSGYIWCRDEPRTTRHTAAQIDEAVEKSLKRLRTDYIDLYQLHWLDRPHQGGGFGHDSYYDYDAQDMEPLEDILGTLSRHVEKGNIRHIGLSNETPWGTMKYLELSKTKNLPRPVSIQNVYNLLARRFDYGLAEIAMREDIGLLAYSPLAMGLLSGKYDDGAVPEGSRKAVYPHFLGRYKDTDAMIKDCNTRARDLGLTPVQFALKFIDSRDFVTTDIIGATTLAQLKDNIDAHDIEWTQEMEEAAHELHCKYRSPVS